MIQNHFILLFCLFFLVTSCIIYQYFEVIKNKKESLLHLEIIKNEIIEEQGILNKNNKEVSKVDELEKSINKKIISIKTKIVTLDFSLKELIECLTIS